MLQVFKSYLAYLIKAKNLHRVHSPFVFDLYQDCIKSEKNYYVFNKIEYRRKQLLIDRRTIEGNDPGAGKNERQLVSEIARKSLVSPDFGKILFELTRKLECKNVLELGTSLGISASYLASYSSDCLVYTIEGRNEIAEIAKETFDSLNQVNVKLYNGLFDDVLPTILKPETKFDLVYLDGNHRLDATLGYVQKLIPHLHENSVIVVDDIRWSSEMWNAWKKLKSMDNFHVNIDLMRMGLLFTRPSQARENFTLYYK
ncbi:MAG: class I SAM-dependent methyltransferase [Bacteroidia bacterium]